MYTNYFLNRWFLIYYLFMTIREIHFLKSKWLLILEGLYIYYFIQIKYFCLYFIHINLLTKYYNKIPINYSWVCSKNEIFDHSSNICLKITHVFLKSFFFLFTLEVWVFRKNTIIIFLPFSKMTLYHPHIYQIFTKLPLHQYTNHHE